MILNCLFLCIIKTMENNNSLKYTCLFGGGAIRGAAYVVCNFVLLIYRMS